MLFEIAFYTLNKVLGEIVWKLFELTQLSRSQSTIEETHIRQNYDERERLTQRYTTLIRRVSAKGNEKFSLSLLHNSRKIFSTPLLSSRSVAVQWRIEKTLVDLKILPLSHFFLIFGWRKVIIYCYFTRRRVKNHFQLDKNFSIRFNFSCRCIQSRQTTTSAQWNSFLIFDRYRVLWKMWKMSGENSWLKLISWEIIIRLNFFWCNI